jgi:ATP-binding cassette, subfamily B, bacterial PglK
MKLLADIWRLLDAAQRRRLLVLQAVAVTMAISTLIGIAGVVPFFAVLGDPTAIDRSAALSWLFRYFHFRNHHEFLSALGIAFLALVLCANAINLSGSLAMNRFAHSIGDEFGVALFDEYLHRSHQFHLASNSATLFNNVVWEVSRGVTAVVQSLFLLSTNAVTSALIMASIVLLNPFIALAVGGALAGSYALIYLLVRQRLLRNGSLESQHTEERTGIVNETLGAIREVIVTRGQAYFRDKYAQSSSALSRAALNTHAISASPRYILECIVVASLVGVALLLFNAGEGRGLLLAQLSFLGFAAYRLLPALQQIFQAVVRIRADRVAFNRIADDLRSARLATRQAVGDRFDAQQASRPGRQQGPIQLKQVAFRYSADRPLVIRDVSLNIAPGTTVGFVGPSGCGKTTLVELLIGLLTPTSGTVCIDGIALDESNRGEWQATIGYVPQHSFLFDASLAENIALATAYESIDFDRLSEAVRLAQLEGFVKALPNGYREKLGERGVRLSGGQRQRVAIARALYRRASVLVLDEATNALDGLTEGEVMATLAGLRGSHTIILISHRPSTARQCDSVFELDGGALVHRTEELRLVARDY